MNLSELSDYEINKMVAEIKFPGWHLEPSLYNASAVFVGVEDNSEGYFNYCNDDALAFRLMVDNKIDLDYLGGEFWHTDHGDFSSCVKNPNRSVAETFILMNQGGDK